MILKPKRLERLKRILAEEPVPFSHFLIDNFNRKHSYLRISVTERCSLRCKHQYYCVFLFEKNIVI